MFRALGPTRASSPECHSTHRRANEVMKVLTIVASIFIPLTFIAGIYGMNFEYMPELRRPVAYPIGIGVMVVAAGLMLAYFWYRGGIGGRKRSDR